MKIITRVYKTYSFKELNQHAKNVAIENNNDVNYYDAWYEDDYLLDDLLPKKIQMGKKLKMLEVGKKLDVLFKWNHIYFDLDRSNYLSIESMEVVNDDLFRQFLKIPRSLWKQLDVRFDNTGERNSSLTLEFIGNETVNLRIDRAESIFNDLISRALSVLKSRFESLSSRESIIETLKINEYRFLKDGTIFN